MAATATATTNSLFSDDASEHLQGPNVVSSSVPSTSECSHRGGFTGMFKVPSLVFDIELEDHGIGGHWQEDDWEEDEVVSEIQRFIQPSTPTEARLLSDVKVACPHAKDGQDTPRLVSILSALGYKCSLRTALGGGDGVDCLRNLRHTFIVCETAATLHGPARRYLVDPQFKEQFIIAKTTARYAAILASIPQVFVGPEEHLTLLVNFLCSEMSTAFRQLGSVLPPWRQASSMLSKWRPRKSVDLENLGGLAAAAVAAAGTAGGGGGARRCVDGAGEGGIAAAVPSVQLPAAAQQVQWTGMDGPASGAQGVCGKPSGGLQQQGLQVQYPQLHHWQQAAQAMHPAGSAAAAGAMIGAPRAVPVGVRRPSFEPQRVVFGGNFVPITPSPTLAS